MNAISIALLGCLIQLTIATKYARDTGSDPLILTPDIEAGNLAEAKAKAAVSLPQYPDMTSYSGFVTVDKEKDSNMFFWMIPAETDPENKPLLLWLQGGPGSSSMKHGMLRMHGPFEVNEDMTVSEREYRWTKDYNMVYVDNPVGAGYSFTNGGDEGYSQTLESVGVNLYTAMSQIIKLFPEYSEKFYITGEAFGCKHMASFAHYIHNLENSEINFEGLIIWAGWCDSAWMFRTYPDLVYNAGHIDEDQRDDMKSQLDVALDFMEKDQYMDAFEAFDKVMYVYRLVTEGYKTTYMNMTGMNNIVNFIEDAPANLTLQNMFFNIPSVKEAIHVGNLEMVHKFDVIRLLRPVIVQSVAPWLAEIADAGYKVLMVAGNVDVITSGPGVSMMINEFDWSSEKAAAYKAAERYPWRLNADDVGVSAFIKSSDNFHFVMMRNGGHYTPEDCPVASLELMKRFISDMPLYP